MVNFEKLKCKELRDFMRKNKIVGISKRKAELIKLCNSFSVNPLFQKKKPKLKIIIKKKPKLKIIKVKKIKTTKPLTKKFKRDKRKLKKEQIRKRFMEKLRKKVIKPPVIISTRKPVISEVAQKNLDILRDGLLKAKKKTSVIIKKLPVIIKKLPVITDDFLDNIFGEEEFFDSIFGDVTDYKSLLIDIINMIDDELVDDFIKLSKEQQDELVQLIHPIDEKQEEEVNDIIKKYIRK